MKHCLVDISNMVHRAKHSVASPTKMNSVYHDPFGDNAPSNPDADRIGLILTTVMQGVLNSFTKFQSDHCVIMFDTKSWRRAVYPEYKGHRRSEVKTPAEEHDYDLVNGLIDRLREFLHGYTNVTVLNADQVEADDFIARWVQLHDDDSHVIISADGDFKQLVRDGVDLYNPMSHILYTIGGVFHQDKRAIKGVDEVVMYGQPWYPKLDKNGSIMTFDPKWELFEKCIRGDTSDNIRSAYPRVYTTKMRKAFEGSVEEYNNFINSTWGKDGEKHSVREQYEFNKHLIDLTDQPQYVIDIMDETIMAAIEKKRARMVGAHFAKFCSKYRLMRLIKQADRFTNMLSRSYT